MGAGPDLFTQAAGNLEREVELLPLEAGPGKAVAGLMVDIDNVKRVNDDHGHGTGDEDLRRVATLILAAARPGDLVDRYGGEEFSVILRSTSRAQARPVADRVRTTVAEADIPLAEGATVAIGVAAGRSEQIAMLFEHADRALCRSKAPRVATA